MLRVPEPKLALSAADKVEREAVLTAKIDALQREEETLIETAAEQGQVIERRVNADPAAVLGVRVREANAQAA